MGKFFKCFHKLPGDLVPILISKEIGAKSVLSTFTIFREPCYKWSAILHQSILLLQMVVVVMMIVTDGGGCDVDSDRWWWL